MDERAVARKIAAMEVGAEALIAKLVKAEEIIAELRAALAAATERAEAAEARAKQAESSHDRLQDTLTGLHDRALDAEARADALAALCKESLETLRHARVFVTSRQKMHPHGVELWDALAARLREVADREHPA